MSNDILEVTTDIVTDTITLTSLGSGAGRECVKISLSGQYPRITFEGWFQATSSPTAGLPLKVYAIFHDGSFNTAGLTGTDAAVATEPKNAQIIAAISVEATTSAQYWRGSIEHPGKGYVSIVVWNGMNVAFDATAGHHVVQHYFSDEQVQAG